MPLSIWEYLRARTRDAVLAGFQDAFDVAEQGDRNGSQHDAANRLVAKLAATEAAGLPEPSRNGSESREGNGAQATPLEAPRRPTEPVQFEDELERRIDAAAPQRAQERPLDDPRHGQPSVAPTQSAEERPLAPVPPGRITNRKRGRPPKNRQDANG
jgi:hypothetical protein